MREQPFPAYGQWIKGVEFKGLDPFISQALKEISRSTRAPDAVVNEIDLHPLALFLQKEVLPKPGAPVIRRCPAYWWRRSSEIEKVRAASSVNLNASGALFTMCMSAVYVL